MISFRSTDESIIVGSLLKAKVNPRAIAKNVMILKNVCFVILEKPYLMAANVHGFAT